MLEVGVKFVQNNACRKVYGNVFNPNSMVCAFDDGKDSCEGDSGGPLIATDTSALIGITSWGHECASAFYPGVYVRVSTFEQWIDHVVYDDLSLTIA
mmetsp:Transcript_22629/g.33411  ORF Transcript_22629/g.33411 Transcript_22629/m.33411 type:complete len:97 (+) Transcript_22629:679-969(+)